MKKCMFKPGDVLELSSHSAFEISHFTVTRITDCWYIGTTKWKDGKIMHDDYWSHMFTHNNFRFSRQSTFQNILKELYGKV